MPVPSQPPDTGLTVESCIGDLRAALADRGSAVLEAPPGAGKTTVVPLRLLAEPWVGDGRIIVLEPRRLAARAAARRMAQILGEAVGATVGYRTRDESRVGPDTRIEVLTDGILVRRLQRDPSLAGTAAVCFDEVHERNLSTDLALALALDARTGLAPDLRLVAMSATLEGEATAELLGGDDGPAPRVTSEGRSFPVEVRWAPPDDRERLDAATARMVARALAAESGDVLVFLAGMGEIGRVRDRLAGSVPDDVDVRTLAGALSPQDQDAALAPSPPGRQRVVLATDIAETSLTVEGIRVVVDAGEVRRPRYDPASGMTRLVTGPVSRASAEQRTGRAGRTQPGVAYRLWAEAAHRSRPAHPIPEIAAVDLADLALELAVWGAEPGELAFADPPPAPAMAEARALLAELGLLDHDGRPTAAGHVALALPLHPRLARMVAWGRDAGHGWEACALAAALAERDVLGGRPEEVPTDAAQRLRLVGDRDASHPVARRAALDQSRRLAKRLARQVNLRPGPVDVTVAGPLLAAGYPDRVAQATAPGRFRLRTGRGAQLAGTDPLATESFLAVGDVDGAGADARIRVAGALDADDVAALAGDAVTTSHTVAWDEARDDLRARSERRWDELVLAAEERPAEPGEATTAALVAHVRAIGLEAIGWSGAARRLADRARFAAHRYPDWPSVDEADLLGEADTWLAARLAGARGRADLARVDLAEVVRSRLGRDRVAALDRIAPTLLTASGRELRLDYPDGERPELAVRAQELFGMTTHPTVDDDEPVVIRVRSPANRDIQVTADLPGFWAGTWAEVRKDMAGRYPKHDWPVNLASATPPM